MILDRLRRRGYTFVQVAIWVVVALAVISLVYVAQQQFGVEIPWFVRAVFWICVVACVVIAAIKFIASQSSGGP